MEQLNLLSIRKIEKLTYITNFKDLEHEIQKLKEFFLRNIWTTKELILRFSSKDHTLVDVLPAFDIGFHKIIIQFLSDQAYVDQKSKLSQEDWVQIKHFFLNHHALQQLNIIIMRNKENLLPTGTININLNYRDIAEKKLDAFYACESYADYEIFFLKYLKR